MAAVLGDLLQITDIQSYLGQQVLNVYYYRVTDLTGFLDPGYLDLLAEFETRVIVPILAVQNVGLLHVGYEVRNLSNGVDIAYMVSGGTGTVTGAESTWTPSYVSLGFKLVRESLLTRNGYKRIAGLSEGMIAGNTFTFPSGVQASIEAGLASDLFFTLVTVAEPVIVKRPIPSPAGSSYVYASVGAAQYTALGTQNTRKAGRGI